MQSLISAANVYFPDLKVKYKDSSNFMKLLSYILFFNKRFMTSYTTTIGSTVYFPNEKFIKSRPTSSATIFLHELVHIYDAKRFNVLLYSFLYLFPISLLLVALPLFIVSWKIALVLTIISLTPLPSYFRMYFERRAYMVSLYAIQKLSEKMNFKPYLDKSKDSFISEFKSSSYYFMWVFPSINTRFNEAVIKIQSGKRPYEDPIFDIIDNLLDKIETTTKS
jgi:hypothetical protein